ncbi:MAG: hypothetical protein QOJ57_2009 [Thermoleophilaceae bacterium]|jgi:hypothetical protein|nr:hypothetical protein [Thermoleophilaceae bacterium]
MDMPLLLTSALFAVFAVAEWRRLPVVARVYLGVATAFAIGAATYPGMSITDVLDGTRDGLVYLLAVARVAAFTAVLVSVTTFLRERALG